MILSKTQFSCITLLHAEEHLQTAAVNVLTLASLLRRGLIKPFQRNKVIKLTPLGVQVYKWNTSRRILAWKEELASARELKYGKK